MSRPTLPFTWKNLPAELEGIGWGEHTVEELPSLSRTVWNRIQSGALKGVKFKASDPQYHVWEGSDTVECYTDLSTLCMVKKHRMSESDLTADGTGQTAEAVLEFWLPRCIAICAGETVGSSGASGSGESWTGELVLGTVCDLLMNTKCPGETGECPGVDGCDGVLAESSYEIGFSLQVNAAIGFYRVGSGAYDVRLYFAADVLLNSTLIASYSVFADQIGEGGEAKGCVPGDWESEDVEIEVLGVTVGGKKWTGFALEVADENPWPAEDPAECGQCNQTGSNQSNACSAECSVTVAIEEIE